MPTRPCRRTLMRRKRSCSPGICGGRSRLPFSAWFRVCLRPDTVPLHRAAVTLRQEHFAHVLAGYDTPVVLNAAHYDVLARGEFGILRTPVADPDLDYLGEAPWPALIVLGLVTGGSRSL